MSIAKSESRSNRPPQSGFYLLLLVTLVPVAFLCGWMAKGLSEGKSFELPKAMDQAAEAGSPSHESDVELMVELQMLEAEKKIMEDEIAEARAAGSGLDTIVEGELRRTNEKIAQLKQKLVSQKDSAQKDSAPTAEGRP